MSSERGTLSGGEAFRGGPAVHHNRDKRRRALIFSSGPHCSTEHQAIKALSWRQVNTDALEVDPRYQDFTFKLFDATLDPELLRGLSQNELTQSFAASKIPSGFLDLSDFVDFILSCPQIED